MTNPTLSSVAADIKARADEAEAARVLAAKTAKMTTLAGPRQQLDTKLEDVKQQRRDLKVRKAELEGTIAAYDALKDADLGLVDLDEMIRDIRAIINGESLIDVLTKAATIDFSGIRPRGEPIIMNLASEIPLTDLLKGFHTGGAVRR